MAFEKRVCVLKQVKKGFTADGSALSGAVYCERLGEELTVSPRLLGIAPVREGRYALALWIEGQVLISELKDSGSVRLPSPSIKAGLAVLLVYIRGDAEPVAFGRCGAAPATYETLLAAFKKSEKKRAVPVPPPPTEVPTFSPNNVPLTPTVPLSPDEAPDESEEEARSFRREQAATNYDDEAIAGENYYGDAADGDGPAAGTGEEEAVSDGAKAAKDDGAVHPFCVPKGSLTYYNTVRAKLNKAFQKFPKDTRLNEIYPCSEWVKTDSALLGIIYEGGIPRFLCVAVEAGDAPPEEMKEHCCFVPSTPFSDMVGFYVVFQSADTGEYVTVSDS